VFHHRALFEVVDSEEMKALCRKPERWGTADQVCCATVDATPFRYVWDVEPLRVAPDLKQISL
jgi:hypothetical protein